MKGLTTALRAPLRSSSVAIVTCLLSIGYESATYAQIPTSSSIRRLITIRVGGGSTLILMGDWREGVESLESTAKERGLSITGGDHAGMGFELEGSIQLNLTNSFGAGIGLEYLHDRNSFVIEDVIGFPVSPGLADYITFADASSTIIGAIVSYRPFAPRMQIFLRGGVGVGFGSLDFGSPGGDAEGDGNGLALSGTIGIDWKAFYASIGARYHRFNIDYTQFRDSSPPSTRDWFTDEAELRSFVEGRRVDFSGLYLKAGLRLDLIGQ